MIRLKLPTCSFNIHMHWHRSNKSIQPMLNAVDRILVTITSVPMERAPSSLMDLGWPRLCVLLCMVSLSSAWPVAQPFDLCHEHDNLNPLNPATWPVEVLEGLEEQLFLNENMPKVEAFYSPSAPAAGIVAQTGDPLSSHVGALVLKNNGTGNYGPERDVVSIHTHIHFFKKCVCVISRSPERCSLSLSLCLSLSLSLSPSLSITISQRPLSHNDFSQRPLSPNDVSI